jgi:hypothetical protein
MISAGVTVMGSLALWSEPQSPSPDPSKGWMCNLISWTGSTRGGGEARTISVTQVTPGQIYEQAVLTGVEYYWERITGFFRHKK